MEAPTTAPTAKAVKMELKRNYVPKQLLAIVGYQQEERKSKDAAGREYVTQERKWVEGEMYPPIYAGVGFPNKIWAGTVIEVPEDEAREMRSKGIAEAYL
jgi:hypothetical protein